MPRALITGASSGIGLAIAEEFATRGHDIVLVARNETKLRETAQKLESAHSVSCEIFPADIAVPEDLQRIQQLLAREQEQIDILVNNAGIGLPDGGYLDNPMKDTIRMNQLNIDAVISLTHNFVQILRSRGRGGVITVASIAGFYPGTAAVTYSASKSWAIAFGEGLHTLLEKTGVRSTTVAPGFVRSQFHERAGISSSGIPNHWWLSATQVARETVDGYERRKALVIPGARWKIWYSMFSKLPRSCGRKAFAALMRSMSQRAQ